MTAARQERRSVDSVVVAVGASRRLASGFAVVDGRLTVAVAFGTLSMLSDASTSFPLSASADSPSLDSVSRFQTRPEVDVAGTQAAVDGNDGRRYGRPTAQTTLSRRSIHIAITSAT